MLQTLLPETLDEILPQTIQDGETFGKIQKYLSCSWKRSISVPVEDEHLDENNQFRKERRSILNIILLKPIKIREELMFLRFKKRRKTINKEAHMAACKISNLSARALFSASTDSVTDSIMLLTRSISVLKTSLA
ncbi:hypothetical protein CEXT_101811 [Caerostris extrusa]|uniref:Uncharacterized protein n=1 Tax=Caerostris extrusa TaxID=172846 RepID=A0AAV4PA38_CAEEX|nr:hypothetical protein CEXT_101811 [Caerostris extrusa]